MYGPPDTHCLPVQGMEGQKGISGMMGIYYVLKEEAVRVALEGQLAPTGRTLYIPLEM